jgi:hypothetical protein
MRRIRRHLSLANVVSLIALFVALGGTAVGAVIINNNNQVAPNTISGHHPPSGKHANIISRSINGQDVQHLKFQPLTLKNGWAGNCSGAGTPAIAKSVEGVVHFRGAICRTSGSSLNPFALPAGFIPSKFELIAVSQQNAAMGRIEIAPGSGQATLEEDPEHPGAGASFTSLAGVSYTLPF